MVAESLGTLHDELKDLVRDANFDDGRAGGGRTVRVIALKLRSRLPDDMNVDMRSLPQIKAAVLLAEVYDYYGQFDASAEAARSGKDVLASLMPPSSPTPRDKLSQAKIRLAVAYARSLYRAYQHDDAASLLHACRDYVVQHLVTPSFPCCGTLGEIAYTLGRVHRQHQHFSGAFEEFNTAISLYDDRVDHKLQADPLSGLATVAFSAHKVATITALGVGWCNYTQGALRTAKYANLIPARLMLRRSGDVLNTAYADVIYASVLRALAGKDASVLASARQLATDAETVFVGYGHRHYAAGAALQLALTALVEKNTKEATQHWQRLDDYAQKEDIRWKRSAMIVHSRILRITGQYESARSVATKALRLAREQHEQIGQIDALIARGETYREQERCDVPIQDLLRAVRLNRRLADPKQPANPKVHAICHLHLAQNYIKLGRMHEALASFTEWERVRTRVEHKNIHELAASIAPKLNRTTILEFDITKHGLSYQHNERRLREFLLAQASMRAGNQQETADLLDVTRQTVAKWQTEAKKTSKP